MGSRQNIVRYVPGTAIHTAEFVINDIVHHLKTKTPFSLVRFGDAALKFTRKYWRLERKGVDLSSIKDEYPDVLLGDRCLRDGIKTKDLNLLFNYFTASANIANYIDCMSIWADKRFWRLSIVKSTAKEELEVIHNWRKYHKYLGITNTSYCNPDIGFIMFLPKYRFLEAMKGRKVCFITSKKGTSRPFTKAGVDVTKIMIPTRLTMDTVNKGKGRLAITHSDLIPEKLKEIEELAADLYLVGAGFWTKAYCHHIKKIGKVAVDVGKMMDYWDNKEIPPRNKRIFSPYNALYVNLSDYGNKFSWLL